jgi:release factor glutamine methyltransferase
VPPVTVRRLLESARLKLAANDDPGAAPALEAELLLARALKVDRAYLYAHPATEIGADLARRFQALVRRRARGEPLAYITGEQEFWSLPLSVTPDVLIPRPETEHLVERALERLSEGGSARVADIGTGSGAIALAIASERPAASVHAVDVSEAALAVARDNARRLGLDNVRFHLGSWCAPLEGQFDLVASNPPYVRDGDPHLEQGDLRFEPRIALTPGSDELAAFRSIADGARERLRPGGWLLFEHGFEQGPAVRALLERRGWRSVASYRDLARRERVTAARRP